MQPARSLVMAPLSTVWTHTFSRVCANLRAPGQSEAPASRAGPGTCPGPAQAPSLSAHLMRSWFPSSFPRCSRPRVQAKMLAMGFVLVGRPWGQGSQGIRSQTSRQGTQLPAPGLTGQNHPPSLPRQWVLSRWGRRTVTTVPTTHLLVFPIMAGDRSMSSLSLNGLPIRADQHRRHQAKGAKA